MVTGDSDFEGALGGFLTINYVEILVGFLCFYPCFCNFYIFAKGFNFADIFEM